VNIRIAVQNTFTHSVTEERDRTDKGRELFTCGAATAKALSPIRVFVRGMERSLFDCERKDRSEMGCCSRRLARIRGEP
jgi:hypothetical protein